jgi:hypothetical protein
MLWSRRKTPVERGHYEVAAAGAEHDRVTLVRKTFGIAARSLPAVSTFPSA